MFKEDRRELLTPDRAAAILRKAWKEMMFVRLLILFLFLAMVSLAVSLLSILFPSYGVLYALVGAVCLGLIGINVYYLVSEYLWIKNGEFCIEEDQVASVFGYETSANKMLLHSLSDFLSYFAFLAVRDWKKATVFYLDFKRHGQVEVDSKMRDRAVSGDTFYLIVYRKNRRVRKVLSANTYRLK